MARSPDLFPAFRVLDPHEQTIILAWEEEIGADLESVPPLAALVTMLATLRVADTLDGSIEARFQGAAAELGIGDGDSLRRKLDWWRGRSGKNLRETAAGKVQVSGD